MKISLSNWGLSSLLPAADREPPQEQKKERKARQTGGEPVQLPPATNAAPLFENTRRFIESELISIASLNETLQGGRFITEAAGGAEKATAGRGARGGQWFPNPDLTRLIGSCIVEYGGNPDTIERLLDALHPEPVKANRKDLSLYLYGIDRDAKGGPKERGDGLMQRVAQVSALIRGLPEIKRGAKPPPITPMEQIIAWSIKAQLEEGLSEDAVASNIQVKWDIDQDEYSRLRNIARGF